MLTEDTGSDFNLDEMAEAIDTEPSDTSLETDSEVGGQSETNHAETEEQAELSLEEITKGLTDDGEAPKTDANLLAMVNALNLKRGDEAIQLKDEKEVAELIQKGFDYSKKSMEREESYRQKEEEFTKKVTQKEQEFAQKEQEISTIKQEQTILETAISKLQRSTDENDKYLLSELSRIYNESLADFERTRPYQAQLENQFKTLREEIDSLKGQKTQEELGAIKSTWDQELAQTQAELAPTLKTLKLESISWDKVKEIWKSDATNKMTVGQAFMAAYGKDLNAAYKSHLKLLEVKNKKQGKILGRTGASGGLKEKAVQTRSDDLGEFLRAASETM
jgi:hypothetical protein